MTAPDEQLEHERERARHRALELEQRSGAAYHEAQAEAELARYHFRCRWCGDALRVALTTPSSCRACASPDRLEECE
jgi:rubrerythrin